VDLGWGWVGFGLCWVWELANVAGMSDLGSTVRVIELEGAKNNTLHGMV
jgi:hypothetical protein